MEYSGLGPCAGLFIMIPGKDTDSALEAAGKKILRLFSLIGVYTNFFPILLKP